MAEKTEAQKRAQKKYMASFVEIKVRMTPEKRSAIQAHAKAMGESTTVFINRAIDQTMSRDDLEAGTVASAGGVVSGYCESENAAPAAHTGGTADGD